MYKKVIYLFANESGTINIASSGLKVEQTVVYVEADGLITSFPITVEPSTKIYEVAFTMTGYELGGSIDNWGISVDTEHVFLTSINGVSVDISNQSDLDGDGRLETIGEVSLTSQGNVDRIKVKRSFWEWLRSLFQRKNK